MIKFFLISNTFLFFFFFNDTATTEIYTLSLHDALPSSGTGRQNARTVLRASGTSKTSSPAPRSEEHMSELQSRPHLVCRILLEKKKQKYNKIKLHKIKKQKKKKQT